MDLKNYINLVKNHNYKGKIGLVKKQINFFAGFGLKPGDIVLYRSYEYFTDASDDYKTKKYNKNHCTIEQPMSEDEIQKQKENGSCLTTHSSCVGVPLSSIEEIII